ncbi:MAG: transcription antitermination factor NusB, partial [Bacteroidia bacterium]|nr:transcription antitermination factor NusB [Bacteroidia bacterium]
LESEQKSEQPRYRYFRYIADQIEKEINILPTKYQRVSIDTKQICKLLQPIYKRLFTAAINEWKETEPIEEQLYDVSVVGEFEVKLLLSELIHGITQTPKSVSYKNFEWFPKIAYSSEFKQEDFLFMNQMYQTVIQRRSEYEEIILKLTDNWDLDRIAKIDRILLCMALYEMMNCTDIPRKVTLQEYIDIANAYSTIKSAQFVNGILDAAWKLLSQEGKIQKFGLGLIEY